MNTHLESKRPGAPAWHRLPVAAACALLASCGGGDGDAATDTASPPAAAGADSGLERAQAVATSWTALLQEHQQTALADSNPRIIRFGHASYGWVEKSVQSWISCSVWFFGQDPAPGVVKACEQASAAAASPAAASGWSVAAAEGQTMSFADSSARNLRYGTAGNGWLYKTSYSASVACATSYFGGDPAPGVSKSCEVFGTSGSVAAPAPAPAPASAQAWSFAAWDGQTMSFGDASARNLRYGTAGNGWLYRTSFSASVACNASSFGGDPAPGASKSCEVYSAASSAPTPAPAPPAPAPAPSPAASTWRPFNASSPWNTPIAANPALHPNSTQLINTFATSSPWGEHLDINMINYSVPLYWADAGTPKLPVYASVGGEGWNGWPATLNMPIPNGAVPDPQSDAHMLVVDSARTTEWGCYGMSYNAGRNPAWQGLLCATADLTGSGVRTPQTTAFPWYLAHGARACGFPLIAGLIRTEEIQAGAIEHALVMAYPKIMNTRFMVPASTGSAIGVSASEPGMPCGARVQLDPSLDVTQLGLSPAAVVVARALQKYGAYVGDYSGALSLYAENSAGAMAYWKSGVLDTYDLSGKLDLRRLRVIAYGQTYN